MDGESLKQPSIVIAKPKFAHTQTCSLINKSERKLFPQRNPRNNSYIYYSFIRLRICAAMALAAATTAAEIYNKMGKLEVKQNTKKRQNISKSVYITPKSQQTVTQNYIKPQ